MNITQEKRVHRIFETIFVRYDLVNSMMSFGLHKMWRRDTMQRIQVSEGQVVLDLCCGTGDWTIALAKAAGKMGKVIGLDFSYNMLKMAAAKVKKEGLENIELVHGNAKDPPFSDNTFDCVTIGFGLRNTSDYSRVIAEMYRVLKPGGKLVCLEMTQPTIPGYRQLYYLYLRLIVPQMGKLLARHYEEYTWLFESISQFPAKGELTNLFTDMGLVKREVRTYCGSVAAMHYFVK